MKLILDEAIADEKKNLVDIEMKVMIQEGKIRIERIRIV